MGAFGQSDSFYSMPPGNPNPKSPEMTKPEPAVENPPYARYQDSGVDSFAPLPSDRDSFASSVTQSQMQEQQLPAVVGPPAISIPLIAIGLGFLFWVMSRND